MEKLALEPVLVMKPSSRDTWSLTPASEQRLTAWMLENLELAICQCSDPEPLETELIRRLAPPLNLAKCVQSTQHQQISAARADVLARLEGPAHPFPVNEPTLGLPLSMPIQAEQRLSPIRSSLDNAEAIAAHFGLNSKTYRQRLRQDIAWYQKPQVWTFSPGSQEWHDMIEVAESMAGRSR